MFLLFNQLLHLLSLSRSVLCCCSINSCTYFPCHVVSCAAVQLTLALALQTVFVRSETLAAQILSLHQAWHAKRSIKLWRKQMPPWAAIMLEHVCTPTSKEKLNRPTMPMFHFCFVCHKTTWLTPLRDWQCAVYPRDTNLWVMPVLTCLLWFVLTHHLRSVSTYRL